VFFIISFTFEYVDKDVSAEFEVRTAVFAENAAFWEIIVPIGKYLPKFRNLQGRSVGRSVSQSNVPVKVGGLLFAVGKDHPS
jgi:hypothetical protein